MSEDLIPGGMGDTIKVDELDRVQLKIGTMVEFEHTNDKRKAIEIAKDHLAEDPEYYTKLYQAGLVDEPGAIAYIKKQGIHESARTKLRRIIAEELSNFLIEYELNKQVNFDMEKHVSSQEISGLTEEHRQLLQSYFAQKRIHVDHFDKDYMFHYDSTDTEVDAVLSRLFSRETAKKSAI